MTIEREANRSVSSRAYREQGTPVKSRAESGEQNWLRRLKSGRGAPLRRGDQHRGGRSIAIAGDVGIEFFGPDLESLGDLHNQVLICLMHQKSADGRGGMMSAL